jgi:hypothetical protein
MKKYVDKGKNLLEQINQTKAEIQKIRNSDMYSESFKTTKITELLKVKDKVEAGLQELIDSHKADNKAIYDKLYKAMKITTEQLQQADILLKSTIEKSDIKQLLSLYEKRLGNPAERELIAQHIKLRADLSNSLEAIEAINKLEHIANDNIDKLTVDEQQYKVDNAIQSEAANYIDDVVRVCEGELTELAGGRLGGEFATARATARHRMDQTNEKYSQA